MKTIQERADALLERAKAHGMRWYPHDQDAELRHAYTMAWLDGYHASANRETLQSLKARLAS